MSHWIKSTRQTKLLNLQTASYVFIRQQEELLEIPGDITLKKHRFFWFTRTTQTSSPSRWVSVPIGKYEVLAGPQLVLEVFDSLTEAQEYFDWLAENILLPHQYARGLSEQQTLFHS
jgi:hypothetical protein